MTIYLKKGIDNIRFGMNQLEVKAIIGAPDRLIVKPEVQNELTSEYDSLKLRLTFYENDKLGYIRSSNANLTIGGHKIIDQKIDEVRDKINLASNFWEKEEYDFFTTYFNESNWLTLNVEYGSVTGIELGVPFKNDEAYDWPNP